MQQNNAYTSPGVVGGPEADAEKNGILFILNTGSVSVGSGKALHLAYPRRHQLLRRPALSSNANMSWWEG
ncbi:hypothetical protein [Paenibacillus taihuensis]|uniref:hypothetical protein n=1 Tax=Paenibacillus taihuensis TaxID=1156355 RepID=UPI0015F28239|nr:hypothetical protein [Paenibacillus taihuensis]